MKGTQKEKEEDDISIGASILVSVSVLKLAEEPTANIEVKVQHPSHRKKENNDDELVRTAGKTISVFNFQLKKEDMKRGAGNVWDKVLSGVHATMGDEDGRGEEDENEEERERRRRSRPRRGRKEEEGEKEGE